MPARQIGRRHGDPVINTGPGRADVTSQFLTTRDALPSEAPFGDTLIESPEDRMHRRVAT